MSVDHNMATTVTIPSHASVVMDNNFPLLDDNLGNLWATLCVTGIIQHLGRLELADRDW